MSAILKFKTLNELSQAAASARTEVQKLLDVLEGPAVTDAKPKETCYYIPVGVDSILNGSELSSYIAAGAEGCRVGNDGAAAYVAAGYAYTGLKQKPVSS